MDREENQRADYYWEQAARLIAKAKSATTAAQRDALLGLAQQWERLALKAGGAAKTGGHPVGRQLKNVTELEVYRKAPHLRRLHPKDADAEAARRSRQAYEAGDMSSFQFWARVARTAMELGRKTSRGHVRN